MGVSKAAETAQRHALAHSMAVLFAEAENLQKITESDAPKIGIADEFATLRLNGEILVLDLLAPLERSRIEGELRQYFVVPIVRKKGAPQPGSETVFDHQAWAEYRTKYHREHPAYLKWMKAEGARLRDGLSFERRWLTENTLIKLISPRDDWKRVKYSEPTLWSSFLAAFQAYDGKKVTFRDIHQCARRALEAALTPDDFSKCYSELLMSYR